MFLPLLVYITLLGGSSNKTICSGVVSPLGVASMIYFWTNSVGNGGLTAEQYGVLQGAVLGPLWILQNAEN